MSIYRKKCYARAGTSLAILTGLFLAGTISAVGTANANTEQATRMQTALHAQTASHAPIAAEQRGSVSVRHQNVGLMTTVSSDPGGGTTVKTIAIDMQAYLDSNGANIVQVMLPPGVSATPHNIADSTSGCLSDLPCDGQFGGLGDTPPPTTPPTNPASPPGPSAPAPAIPGPPIGGSVDCSVSEVTYTQLYSDDHWQQTTTYKRHTYGSGTSCTDGAWGIPVTNQKPKK